MTFLKFVHWLNFFFQLVHIGGSKIFIKIYKRDLRENFTHKNEFYFIMTSLYLSISVVLVKTSVYSVSNKVSFRLL